MAKKVRRVKKKKTNKSTSESTADQVVVNETATIAEQTLSTTDQFRLDYAYVVKDLRRVFLLAGAMFALLIILNLILQYYP